MFAGKREAQENKDVSKMHLILYSVVLCLIISTPVHSKCPPSYPCLNFTLQFPFTDSKDPDCGLFVVHGCNGTKNDHPRVEIGSGGPSYAILEKVSTNEFLIQDPWLQTALSSRQCFSFSNMSLPHSPSVSFTISPNLTFFTCYKDYVKEGFNKSFQSYKTKDCEVSTVYYKTPAAARVAAAGNITIPPGCGLTQLPLKSEYSSDDLSDMLSAEFRLEWSVSEACNECYHRGGQCLADNENKFFCKKGSNTRTLVLAITIPAAAILIFLAAGYILWQRKKRIGEAYLLSRNLSYDPSSKSDLEDGSFNFGIPIFSYTELVEATCNFDPSKELGDGGFGTVYYGKLRDGREVAIKRLYEHNYRRVEQFLNEIRILTCLRHPNLVSLYGCTSRKSRELLLVYEYIPNGTVADHLHGERAKESPLTWHVRMCIARETAAALAYLHKSDIVHRDVKTNNILLDSNFSVKVADFGLSRLFPTNVTHISTAPQGTPGYVDPEYHQCYQLTDKSDVYSFGVVLIELISSMPAVDISRHKHEINLANLAVNKIQRCAFDELIDPSIGYNSDDEVTRMTTSVAELAFRCLQLEKDMRPSMEEVVAFLHDIHTGQDGDGNHKLNGKIPPSPETDEAVLLKSRIYQSSPTAVTDTWISSSSTTASSVG